MSRELLIARLRSVHGVTNDNALMNSLQDHGLVSDEAVAIDNCADRDLVIAWNRVVEHGEEAA